MLNVLIITTQQCLFEGQANQLIFPGEQGVFEVLRFHRPLISRLQPGCILVDEQVFPISRGVVKIERNTVTAIVDPDAEDGVA